VYAVSLSGRERLMLSNPNQLTLWDVDAAGAALVSQDEVRGAMAALPPGESREKDLSNLDYGLVRDLSADGRQILFDETGDGGGASGLVFIGQTDGTSAVRLGEGAAGGLSPDGTVAAAYDMAESKIVLYPTGPGPSRVLPCGEIGCSYPRFFPDGRRVVFTGARRGHGIQLWVRPIEGGTAVPISPEGIAFTARAVPSPDGRFVLALGSDSRPTLFPVDSGKPETVKGSDAKDYPLAWSSDGRSIYVFNRVSNPCRVYLLDLETGERRLWKELSPPQAAGLVLVSYVIPSRDGKSYVYSFTKILSTLELIHGLQ
jgi:WD40 repeat protein